LAQCSHPHKHYDPVPLTEIPPPSVEAGTADCKMLHFCPHQKCAGLDLDNFCSNRKELNTMDFVGESKTFSYRTINLRETIRNPIKKVREFSLYVGSMANRKACCRD